MLSNERLRKRALTYRQNDNRRKLHEMKQCEMCAHMKWAITVFSVCYSSGHGEYIILCVLFASFRSFFLGSSFSGQM